MTSKKSSSKHYVDNKRLLEELKQYKSELKDSLERGTPKPQLSNYIGKCILDIATNFAKRGQYAGYMFKEDMIMDAVENCVRYIDNFDTEKYDNPHAYLTTITMYAFWRKIKKEKKDLYTKCKFLEHVDLFAVDVDKNIESGDKAGNIQISEHTRKYMEEFMRDYEQ